MKKGASFFSKLSGSIKQKSPVSEPIAPIISPTSSSLPTTKEEDAATHPSDHNAVHLWNTRDTRAFGESQSAYKSLEKEWRQRAEEPKKGRLSTSPSSEVPPVAILGEAEVKNEKHDFPFVIFKLPPALTGYTVDQLQAHRFLVDRRTPLAQASL